MRTFLLVSLLCLPLLPACGDGSKHHPDGYREPEVHRVDLMLQTEDCRSCHGAELDGGTGTSCDSCHPVGWREDCTFCHGGEETVDGAPPRGLADNTDVFGVHTPHVTESEHAPYACTQCHVEPRDVLSVGHAFDDTHGVAEVEFSGGLSPEASWSGDGCSNSYCHGANVGGGSVEVADAPLSCGSCHAPPNATAQQSASLGGEHREHIGHDVECFDCHSNVNEAGDLTEPSSHVDGVATVELPNGITRSAEGRCTGSCHNENHDNDRW